MKTLKHISLSIALMLILLGCDSTSKVITPTFDVWVDSTEYTVGDTVKFSMSGDANIISFYSGEFGNSYDFHNQDRILESVITMKFETQNRSQSAASVTDPEDIGKGFCQANQMHVLLSSDFNSDYTAEGINASTWKDITHLFYLGDGPSCTSSDPYKSSGIIEIGDLIPENEKFHIAFQYLSLPNKEHGNANIWRYQGFSIKAISELAAVELYTQTSALWKPVFVGEWDESYKASAYSTTASATTMRSNVLVRDKELSLWAISDSLFVKKNNNFGQDKAVAIKSLIDTPLREFSYTYDKPGEYEVVFIATNVNISDRQEVIKKVKITIKNKEL